jgi:hypothetical protein
LDAESRRLQVPLNDILEINRLDGGQVLEGRSLYLRQIIAAVLVANTLATNEIKLSLCSSLGESAIMLKGDPVLLQPMGLGLKNGNFSCPPTLHF